MGQGRIKDPLNCPFCQSEELGYPHGWGGSPEFWEQMRQRHLKEHCCPTCGQPILQIPSVWFDSEKEALDSVTTSVDSGTYLVWDKENPWVLD